MMLFVCGTCWMQHKRPLDLPEDGPASDLNDSRMLVLSLVKAIEIIGEAAFRISPAARAEIQDIPWDAIIGMRHRLVHAYFDINLDVLWRTVTDELPSLIGILTPLLAEYDSMDGLG